MVRWAPRSIADPARRRVEDGQGLESDCSGRSDVRILAFLRLLRHEPNGNLGSLVVDIFDDLEHVLAMNDLRADAIAT